MKDPVRLNCSHSFCWACLAQASAKDVSTCPVCRTEQKLNPISIEITAILGAPADKYNPVGAFADFDVRSFVVPG